MSPLDTAPQPRAADGEHVRPAAKAPSLAARPRSIVSVLRMLVLAAIVMLLLLAPSTTATSWLPAAAESRPGTLLGACLLYALLLALPFVPAMEIGLLIMAAFGKWGAVGAYLATVAGLNLAYGLARAWPRTGVIDRQRLPAPLQQAMQYLGRHLPHPFLPAATLALLLNLPGNTAIGGGGGIALLYGASRALSWPRFAATVAVATAVLPALVFVGLL